MRTVNHLTDLQKGPPVILTIGAFDGVHRGHQWLISQIVDRAHRLGYESLVITFNPRPEVLFRSGSKQISGSEEKTRLLADLGVDTTVLIPFTRQVASVPAGEFLDTLLAHVNLAEIWVGADFAFGHNRQGTVDFLKERGRENGFGVNVVTRQALDRVPISSTIIREMIASGDVAEATAFLGHLFSVKGEVVFGHQRGAGLGFPTANLLLPPEQLLPATGIYAGYVRIDGRKHPAAIYVGASPVFGGEQVIVEAFLLDFEGELRGQEVGVDFVARVREDRSFSSVDALVEQMRLDVARV